MSYTKEEIYSPQTTEQIAAHVKEILRLLGEDTSREGLLKTPERVAKALQFTTKGYSEDGIEIIRQAIFDEKYRTLQYLRAPYDAVHRQMPRGLHSQRQDYRT